MYTGVQDCIGGWARAAAGSRWCSRTDLPLLPDLPTERAVCAQQLWPEHDASGLHGLRAARRLPQSCARTAADAVAMQKLAGVMPAAGKH